MKYDFTANETRSLGVELELQIVDAQTLELTSAVDQILQRVPDRWSEKIKREVMQCCCEVNTDICRTVSEIERDLREKLAWSDQTLEPLGMRLLWAGTHPTSPWREQLYSPGERYEWLTEVFQEVSRRLVTFGLHVHVGVESGDLAIQLCDRILRHLPTLLALSVNSPMWNGRDTGLASYRSKVMEALPTAGMPYPMRNWSEYVWLIDHLRNTGFIRSIREIWWDVRPHHEFGTIEVRVMDMPLNMRHLLGVVALIQSLVEGLSDTIRRGAYLFDCHPMLAKQNKWHAARYGMDANLVDPDTLLAVPAPQMARRLIGQCAPYAERLGCRHQLEYLEDIIESGTGAERQREAYRRADDLKDVVRFLLEQQG